MLERTPLHGHFQTTQPLSHKPGALSSYLQFLPRRSQPNSAAEWPRAGSFPLMCSAEWPSVNIEPHLVGLFFCRLYKPLVEYSLRHRVH